MTKVRLNNVDLAWLRLDKATNPMSITVLVHFDGMVNYEALITSVSGIVGRYRRFRQRIVQPQGLFRRPYWEDDPTDRVEDHFERLQLSHPADQAALDDIVNHKLNTPLDNNHPLWRISLVEGYPTGSVMIATIHHCIADGISLLQVLLQMTRPVSIQSPIPATQEASLPTTIPSQARSGFRAQARKPNIFDILAAIARIVFRPPDPPTIFKGQLSTTKKIVWAESIALADLKKIAKSNGATVNDALMAIATGAIRQYMDLRKKVPGKNVRAFILVNMRGRELNEDLGNKFGLVFLTLPINHQQPLERLEAVSKGMNYLKASAEYAATYLILHILGMLPAWVEDLAAKLLDSKGTFVATNVTGPGEQLSMAEVPVTSIRAWVPQSGRIGVGFSFISYNGKMGVGLNTDVGVIPDPEVLLDLFIAEYHSMLALVAEPQAAV